MTKNNQTKLEYLAVADLIPYARNSRTHSEEQVSQIAGSIREFGFTNPVLIDKDGTIVAGHGRVMAARKLEIDKVPCIRLGHLTPAQIRAYVIADNKLALNAGWDEQMLKSEIESIREDGIDLGLTGFSDAEIASLFLEIQTGETDPETEWDGMPEYEAEEPCYRKIVVNFDTEEDVARFFAAIRQSFTQKTKSIWFPEKERRSLKDQEWAADNAEILNE